MDPLALLQDDLKQNHDAAAAALEKLPLVAFGIGPARTTNELLPFLKEFLQEENDEATATMAKHLGGFSKLVGSNENLVKVTDILELMCSIDEPVVRQNAIAAMKQILPNMPQSHVEEHVLPGLQRMSEAGWMTRQSLCHLIPPVYPCVPESKQVDLLRMFQALTSDETPMVRKAVSAEIGPLARNLDKQLIAEYLIQTVQSLAEDHMDYMRAFAPTAFADISGQLTPDENKQVVLPLIETLVMDASWKVRESLVKNFPVICDNMGEETTNEKLVPVYARLLADKEKCVRLAVAQNMSSIALRIKSADQLIEQFTPHLKSYARDESEKVRVAFSTAVVALLEPYGSEPAQKALLPLITEMAEEECALVRSSIFSQISRITDILGVQVLSEVLLPRFLPFAADVKWRVRWEMIGKISLLAKLLGPEAFETRGLRDVLFRHGLQDHVFSIRDRACEMVRDLTELWGPEWALEHLLPEALRLYNTSTNYLHRMIPLRIISLVTPLMGDSASIERHLLPLVILACKDSVANVRFAAAKAVVKVLPHLDATTVSAQLQPVLVHMGRDDDVDVQYYAEIALKQVDSS